MAEPVTGQVIWDGVPYQRNRRQYPIEELRPLAGQWLAWNMEGTKILAHDEEVSEVVRQVRSLGLDTDRVVIEGLPNPAEFDFLQ